MKIAVKTLDNQEVGDVQLADDIFNLEVRPDLLHRAVCWQLNKRRAGTHKTKGISEIRGTTKKPYRQKGTGRARQGSLRSPQFRGGSVIFGPVVRSHETGLQKKMRKLALKHALSAKAQAGQVIILESAQLPEVKTKIVAEKLRGLGIESALIIDHDIDRNFALSTRNLPHIKLLLQAGANVYDVLRHQFLVLTKPTLGQLEERLR